MNDTKCPKCGWTNPPIEEGAFGRVIKDGRFMHICVRCDHLFPGEKAPPIRRKVVASEQEPA